MKKLILAAAMLLAAPAYAQQQLDPQMLQRLLGSMQAQRNQAQDAAAVAEAREP
jgi:hypothetical protein